MVLGRVWDVMDPISAAAAVRETADVSSGAHELCDRALALGSRDNVSAIVVDLRKWSSDESIL